MKWTEIRLERDSRQILEIDAGECDYDGDEKLTLNFAYVQPEMCIETHLWFNTEWYPEE